MPTDIIARFAEFAPCSLHSMECVNKKWHKASYIAYRVLVRHYREHPHLAPIVAPLSPEGTVTDAQYARIAKDIRKEVVERARVVGISVISRTGIPLQDLITQVETRDFLTFFKVLYSSIPLDKRPSRTEMGYMIGKIGIESAALMRKWMHDNSTVLQDIKVLQLNRLKLHILPPEIGLLVNLRCLSLNQNQLWKLPVEMRNLVALKVLILTNNQFREPPPQIKCLAKTLDELHLAGNSISKMPTFYPIRKLDLPRAPLGISSIYITLCCEFAQCSSMIAVNKQWQSASYIAYRTLFNDYRKNPHLAPIVTNLTPEGTLTDAHYVRIVKNTQREVFERAKIVRIDPKKMTLRDLIKEVELSISVSAIEMHSDFNFFKELSNYIPPHSGYPTEIPGQTDRELIKLRRTWMHANPMVLDGIHKLALNRLMLYILPPEINLLSKLVGLNCASNRLLRLPQIGNLLALQELDLSYNHLLEIPSQIFNFLALQELDLSYNHLLEIPVGIGNLLALQVLDISCSGLREIPVEIGNLLALRALNLGYNHLLEIPSQICNLLALQELDLTHNKLREIPSEIGNLLALQVLDLSYNHLPELPYQIGNLLALQVLDLSYNHLPELPYQICNLLALQTLRLRNNQLTKLRLYHPATEAFVKKLCGDEYLLS